MHMGCIVSQGLPGVGRGMHLGTETACKSRLLLRRDEDICPMSTGNCWAPNATFEVGKAMVWEGIQR